jgi:hypothetical protein
MYYRAAGKQRARFYNRWFWIFPRWVCGNNA